MVASPKTMIEMLLIQFFSWGAYQIIAVRCHAELVEAGARAAAQTLRQAQGDRSVYLVSTIPMKNPRNKIGTGGMSLSVSLFKELHVLCVNHFSIHIKRV